MIYRILPLLASLFILGFLLYYSNIFSVVHVLEKSNPYWILIGVSLWLTSVFARAVRWNYLLKKGGISISIPDTIHVYLPSLFISNISPAKLGDLARPLFLKGMKSQSASKSFSSVFIERLGDTMVLITVALMGLFLLNRKMSVYLFLSIGFYVFVFSTGFLILLSEKRTKKLLEKISSFFSKFRKLNKVMKNIAEYSKNLSSSTKQYRNWKIILTVYFLSFIVWFIEAMILFVGFETVGIEVDYLACLFVLAVSALLSVITFLPGGLGIGEAIVLVLFKSMYGLLPSQIIAGMLVSRMYSYWMYVLIGGLISGTSKYKF